MVAFGPPMLNQEQAKPQSIMTSVLCREIRDLGYDGSASVVGLTNPSFKFQALDALKFL